MEGLWMLLTLATRLAWTVKISSLSAPASACRAGWPGGKRVITLWPGVRDLGSRSLTSVSGSAAGEVWVARSEKAINASAARGHCRLGEGNGFIRLIVIQIRPTAK